MVRFKIGKQDNATIITVMDKNWFIADPVNILEQLPAIKVELSKRPKLLIMDISKLNVMDTYLTGLLFTIQSELEQNDGRLEVIINNKELEVWRITGADTQFNFSIK